MGFRVELYTEVAAAIISAGVSVFTAVISFSVNRSKTKSEIAKLKLELEHSDKVRQNEADLKAKETLKAQYAQMLSAIDWFWQALDMNSKQGALEAINSLLAEASGELRESLLTLKQIVTGADAFVGPKREKLQAALEEVSVQFLQQHGERVKAAYPSHITKCLAGSERIVEHKPGNQGCDSIEVHMRFTFLDIMHFWGWFSVLHGSFLGYWIGEIAIKGV